MCKRWVGEVEAGREVTKKLSGRGLGAGSWRQGGEAQEEVVTWSDVAGAI